MRPFRFGVQFAAMEGPAKVREVARHAEAAGYAEVFTPDHIGMPDPFVALTLAAEATTSLRVGTMVINNELHHTGLLARAAATLDDLTGGRFILGMGTGYQRSEHDAVGVPLREPGPRVTRLEESLGALRSLLDTGGASVDGDEIRLAVEDLGVRPAGRVPLLVGGHGPRVVSVAGRFADIYQFTGLSHDPVTGDIAPGGFEFEQLLERRRWLQEAAGDRFDQIDLSCLVQVVHVGDGGDEVLGATSERIGVTPEQLDALPFVLVGSVAEIVDKLLRLREQLGIHHYAVRDAEAFEPVVARLAGT